MYQDAQHVTSTNATTLLMAVCPQCPLRDLSLGLQLLRHQHDHRRGGRHAYRRGHGGMERADVEIPERVVDEPEREGALGHAGREEQPVPLQPREIEPQPELVEDEPEGDIDEDPRLVQELLVEQPQPARAEQHADQDVADDTRHPQHAAHQLAPDYAGDEQQAEERQRTRGKREAAASWTWVRRVLARSLAIDSRRRGNDGNRPVLTSLERE